jgi:UPF0755 protein
VRLLIAGLLVSVLCLVAAAYGWVHQRIALPQPIVDLTIAPGMGAKEVAQTVEQSGAQVNSTLLYVWFRLSGQSKLIKAGSYELDDTTTPRSLLHKLVVGDQALRSITFVEGWTFRQMREALKKADQLRLDSLTLSNQALMEKLGRPGIAPEGRFFPDTYTYPKGSSDLLVLQRALRAMDAKLEAVWAMRDPRTPLQSPEQALILASIVEKETGSPNDRANIAAVFSNRLRLGMRLQTDPTVIYGLGDTFDGNLRKFHLQSDTPWNTYTRAGLPPTPISMPGKAALLATVQPAQSNALYFVARGDGSSQFSVTLDEHNRAVNKYQRGQ